MYKVELENFQGPLDLLLHLIEKMEIDIYNIQISKLTESYLEYINSFDRIPLENAEEYIVMASTLLHIKSKNLLPKNEYDTFYEDEEENLVKQLIDYKNYKLISEELSNLYLKRQEYGEKIAEEIEYEIDLSKLKESSNKLLTALNNIYKKRKEELNNDINFIKYRKEVSLKEVREDIISLLKNKKEISFHAIINSYFSKEEIITFFLCVLELIKENVILCKEVNKDVILVNNM